MTKEISPAVSMGPWPCYSNDFVGVFLAEPFFFPKINVNCKNYHVDSQRFFLVWFGVFAEVSQGTHQAPGGPSVAVKHR